MWRAFQLHSVPFYSARFVPVFGCFRGRAVSCTTLTMTFTAFAVAIIRLGKRADEGVVTQVGFLRNVMGSKSTKTLGRSGENRLGGRFLDEAGGGE